MMKQKSIRDYMCQHDQAVSVTQAKGILKWELLTEKIDSAREAMHTLERCGLDKEAKKMIKDINELELARKQLEVQLNEERRISSRALLVCIAACDVATIAADKFADAIAKTSQGLIKDRNGFTEQVRGIAEQFNKIVCCIDGPSDAVSMYYADFAEKITDKVIPIIEQMVADECKTAKGQQYF